MLKRFPFVAISALALVGLGRVFPAVAARPVPDMPMCATFDAVAPGITHGDSLGPICNGQQGAKCVVSSSSTDFIINLDWSRTNTPRFAWVDLSDPVKVVNPGVAPQDNDGDSRFFVHDFHGNMHGLGSVLNGSQVLPGGFSFIWDRWQYRIRYGFSEISGIESTPGVLATWTVSDSARSWLVQTQGEGVAILQRVNARGDELVGYYRIPFLLNTWETQ